jgi:hypothetical protein
MKKYLLRMTIPVTLALLLAVATVAPAATIISGELFFTTFQNQGGKVPPPPLTTNLWKVSFVYDPADGTKLLIGEQSANLVARIGVNGAGLVEVKADGADSSFEPNYRKCMSMEDCIL